MDGVPTHLVVFPLACPSLFKYFPFLCFDAVDGLFSLALFLFFFLPFPTFCYFFFSYPLFNTISLFHQTTVNDMIFFAMMTVYCHGPQAMTRMQPARIMPPLQMPWPDREKLNLFLACMFGTAQLRPFQATMTKSEWMTRRKLTQ